MAAGSKQIPPEDTLANLLLTFTALSGEFPTAQVSRLPSTGAYQEKILKSLKGEKLLRTYYRDGLRALRLTTTAKKLLVDKWPDRFLPYLSGSTETNLLKSEVPRRLRLHRMAEVLVTMFNANVSVFPWEKPDIFSPTPPAAAPYISRPAYYSSREVKGLGAQAVKIRGSRSTGLLLTDGVIFTVYNTGPFAMKWEYKAEMRLKAMLQTELCQRRLPGQYQNAVLSAIVFGQDMERMIPLMNDGGGQRDYFVLDGNYQHFYYLTSDHKGELILQLLCDAEQRTVLDDILSQDLAPCRPDWIVENDAMDGDSPVLFAYTCDMPRIKRFDTALELHGKTGTLFCFDFQEDVLKQICGPRVNIQCIDFEAYERSVFLSPANN
ncbi:hypothetical protein [Oscillibacter sp.]|uniref:hypothetical protein n=1 Tax=Oscillibacter sp. TaxID=1945593 RepID=UPI00258E1CEE|nr:hypothetical protein [Oscillibacter sp.]